MPREQHQGRGGPVFLAMVNPKSGGQVRMDSMPNLKNIFFLGIMYMGSQCPSGFKSIFVFINILLHGKQTHFGFKFLIYLAYFLKYCVGMGSSLPFAGSRRARANLRVGLRGFAGQPICGPKCELSSSSLGSNPSLVLYIVHTYGTVWEKETYFGYFYF